MSEDAFVEGAVPDIGSATDVRALEELQTKRRMEWEADIKFLVTHPSARRLIWAILQRSNVHVDIYSESHALMARNEGARQMGLWLIEAITAVDHTAYPRLMIDASEDRKVERLIQAAQLEEARKRNK